MKRYINHYRNHKWLYTVYGAVDRKDYLLVAVVPGVGWHDIAIHLRDEEIETLRRSEDEFTNIVIQFVKERDSPTYKVRRIESCIRNLDNDEIEVMEND